MVLLVSWLGCAPAPAGADTPRADVVSVRAEGGAGAYTLLVEVRSDETGCERYADWWEVVAPGGELVYRRILEHSHPEEQPFTRSGGPVPIEPGDDVIVRAHLHDDGGAGGYVGEAVRGNVAAGFAPWTPDPGFAEALGTSPPLPEGCRF